MKESDIHRSIQIKHTDLGGRLFRNNVGLFDLADGRRMRTGLCVGSSDLIGWTPVKITPEMIGKTLAVFTAVEVKKPVGKKATDQQENFIEQVCLSGGIGFISRSTDEHEKNLQENPLYKSEKSASGNQNNGPARV